MRTRLINIMVSKKTKDAFSPDVATALREYANKIDQSNAGLHDLEEHETSNGCKIKVIAGSCD